MLSIEGTDRALRSSWYDPAIQREHWMRPIFPGVLPAAEMQAPCEASGADIWTMPSAIVRFLQAAWSP